MPTCQVCRLDFDRVAKHTAEKHPDEFIRQNELVIKYYREGMSAAKIAALPEIMYTGGTSVVRVLNKYFSPEELEAGRKARIGTTLESEYATGKYDWVKDINVERIKSEEGREKNSEGLKKAYEEGRRGPAFTETLAGEEKKDFYQKVSDTLTAKAAAGELKTLMKTGPENFMWKEDRSTVSRLYRKGKDFGKKQRNLIKQRAGHKCEQCGVTAEELARVRELTNDPRMHLECDHIIPIHKNGSPDWETNGRALCSSCHLKKSTLEHIEMLEMLEASGEIPLEYISGLKD